MKSEMPDLNPELCVPALGVCGWKGAGKTTLLEAVIPILRRRNLRVRVLKHDAHGIDLDHSGKDSDRMFRAGADVFLQGPGEEAERGRLSPGQFPGRNLSRSRRRRGAPEPDHRQARREDRRDAPPRGGDGRGRGGLVVTNPAAGYSGARSHG